MQTFSVMFAHAGLLRSTVPSNRCWRPMYQRDGAIELQRAQQTGVGVPVRGEGFDLNRLLDRVE